MKPICGNCGEDLTIEDERLICDGCGVVRLSAEDDCEEQPSAGPSAIRGDSPSYRDAMNDSGRGHLLP